MRGKLAKLYRKAVYGDGAEDPKYYRADSGMIRRDENRRAYQLLKKLKWWDVPTLRKEFPKCTN